MKKKLIMIATAATLVFSMAIPAFAAAPGRGRNINGNGLCACLCVNWDYCILRDESGNFFDKDTFESNLDKAIDDGLIKADDKEYYLEMYDYCITNGSTTVGLGRGQRNGGGRGVNRYTP